MTRTALRHSLSALGADTFSLTLLGQAAAGDQRQTPKLHPSQLQWAQTIKAASANTTCSLKTRAEMGMTFARNLR